MSRKSYLFDLGNSYVGPIGLVVRVTASSKSEAVSIARDALRSASGLGGQIEIRLPAESRTNVDYVTVFVNPDKVTDL